MSLPLPLRIAVKKFQEIFNLLHGKSENHRGSACAKATALHVTRISRIVSQQGPDTNYTRLRPATARQANSHERFTDFGQESVQFAPVFGCRSCNEL